MDFELQTVYLIFNLMIIDSDASLFYYTTVGNVSDFLTLANSTFHYVVLDFIYF